MTKKKYTFIDLFAGCGGLSEGFYREGFKALAHVEIDHWACETLRARMKHYGYKDLKFPTLFEWSKYLIFNLSHITLPPQALLTLLP